MSVRLSLPSISASHCEYCEHEGVGWWWWGEGGEKKRIGLIHTIVIRSLRGIEHEAKLKDYASILPRLLFVILALVWASPCHLSPSSQTAGRAKHREGCRGAWRETSYPGNR